MDISVLEQTLGITEAWMIKSTSIDQVSQQLNVYLEPRERRSLFSFRDSGRAAEPGLTQGSWHYMQVGAYRTVIHASVASLRSDAPISHVLLEQPAFLGHPERNYSNYVRQQVALAQVKGLPTAVILSLLNLTDVLYQEVSADLKASPVEAPLIYLPTAIDSVWQKVLLNQIQLPTKQMALPMFLSKLQTSLGGSSNATLLQKNADELYRYFLSNARRLELEIDQLCGLNDAKVKSKVEANKTRRKLVLPALQNPVWIDVLTGNLELNSNSVPLNLLLARQRIAFVRSEANADKVAAIQTIRDYVKSNYRSLKPELMLINKAMVANKQLAAFQLPDEDHDVWQKIIDDEEFIPSHNMAYRLLLKKLRNQIANSESPVIRLEAARHVRAFMSRNQGSLKQELKILANHSGQH